MATRVDLNTILDNLKTLFDNANTTTASPIDLSSGLTTRVQKVLTIHPELIPIQASFYPCVTSYVTDKPVTSQDIAKDQLNCKRRATVNIDVVGAVWNQNLTDVTKDPADRDINYLMENVELALRNDSNLTGAVTWQKPSGCTYYATMLNSTVHLRIGILKLQAEVFY